MAKQVHPCHCPFCPGISWNSPLPLTFQLSLCSLFLGPLNVPFLRCLYEVQRCHFLEEQRTMGLQRVLVIYHPKSRSPLRDRVCQTPKQEFLELGPCCSGPRVHPDVYAGLTYEQVRQLPAACHLTFENGVYCRYLWWHH